MIQIDFLPSPIQNLLPLSTKKILFLTTQLPYPPKSGGTVKSWNYVQFLAKNYSLSIACLLKDDDEIHIDEFQKKVPLSAFSAAKVTTERSAINLLRSYFLSPCLNVFRNRSKKLKNLVIELAKLNDILIIDHYEMFQFIPSGYSGKIVLHTHNAEFMLWQRMSELEEKNPLKKWLLKLESSRVKKYEKKIFSKADLIYSTPSDIELYRVNGIDTSKHCLTYHLGNDTLLNLKDLEFEQTEKAITFMGTLSWEPNIDGLVWFLKKVWPTIVAQHSNCKLYILGKTPDDRIIEASKNDDKVIFTGFIEDLESYLKKTRVYIVPLRFGSGMKVKVLEGLYRGVPTVSTSVGAEGLEIHSNKEVMIADDPTSFAEHCLTLLENKELWNQLRDNSRRIASEKYRWEPLFTAMNKNMKALN